MLPNLQVVQQWLEKANADLRMADLAQADSSLVAETGFHCQQSVEKSLKAYLTFHGMEFEWSHNISYLIRLCGGKDPSFSQFEPPAGRLTQFAVQFRYPTSEPSPGIRESRHALAVERDIFQFVLQRLPPPARPAA
jgi:HEPN domain-containing protein